MYSERTIRRSKARPGVKEREEIEKGENTGETEGTRRKSWVTSAYM